MCNKCTSQNLDEYEPIGDQNPSEMEEKLLDEVLNDDNCFEDGTEKFINYFFLAFIAFISFLVLNMKDVDYWFRQQIPNDNMRLLAKAIIIGIIIFIADHMIYRWRKDKC